MKTRYYAGIGSRKTPQSIQRRMTRDAMRLQAAEYVLRSGGAEGADRAFEAGAGAAKQIYTPIKATKRALIKAQDIWLLRDDRRGWPFEPGSYIGKLMGRSAMVIEGLNMGVPVEFVLCWTPRAEWIGGTAQSLWHADSLGIPIYNYADETPKIKDLIATA
ncbi:MAG: hypothetical protein V3R83_09835 [Gammaproteobacteria bacterium]